MGAAELRQHRLTIVKTKSLIWASIIQFLSFIGINVIHHPVYVFLSQIIKRTSLRKDSPNQLMIHLNSTLLVRTSCIPYLL